MEIDNNPHCAGWGECSLLLMQTRCACTASREKERWRGFQPRAVVGRRRRRHSLASQTNWAHTRFDSFLGLESGVCNWLAAVRANPILSTPRCGLHFLVVLFRLWNSQTSLVFTSFLSNFDVIRHETKNNLLNGWVENYFSTSWNLKIIFRKLSLTPGINKRSILHFLALHRPWS